jgi:hypothetical protein
MRAMFLGGLIAAGCSGSTWAPPEVNARFHCGEDLRSLRSYEVARGLWVFCRQAQGVNVRFIEREPLVLQPTQRTPIANETCASVAAAAARDTRLALVCRNKFERPELGDELTFAIAEAGGGWAAPPTSIGNGVVLGIVATGSFSVAVLAADPQSATPLVRIHELREGTWSTRTIDSARWNAPCSKHEPDLAHTCIPIAAMASRDGWRFVIRGFAGARGYLVDESGAVSREVEDGIVDILNRPDFAISGILPYAWGRYLVVTAGLEIGSTPIPPDPILLIEHGRWIEPSATTGGRGDQPCWYSSARDHSPTCVVGTRLVSWEGHSSGVAARDVLTPRPSAARLVAGHTAPMTWMSLGSDLLVIWKDGDDAIFDKDWNRLPRRVQRPPVDEATAAGSGR